MDPSIPARRHRLEIPCLARLIAQYPADLGDDAGEGVVGDGGARPDGVEDFLFGEEVPGRRTIRASRLNAFGSSATGTPPRSRR